MAQPLPDSAAPAALSADRERVAEAVLALIRVTVVAWAFIQGAMGPGSAPQDRSFFMVTTGAAVYALIAAIPLVAGKARCADAASGRRHALRRALLLLIDTVLIALLIWALGGPRSGFFPLFYVPVLFAARWFSLVGAVVATTLALVSSGLLLSRWAGSAWPYELAALLNPHALLLFLIGVVVAQQATALRSERARADREAQRAQQFRRQMDMAEELQQLIAPPELPKLPGLELGVRTRQADVVAGGDYYDAVTFDDGSLALMVADVSGKSFSGQMRLPLIRNAFRVLARQFRKPGEVMPRLAAQIYDDFPRGMFVSLVYLVVEPQANRLLLARAGHCEPLHLVAQTGEVVERVPKGAIMGVERKLKYQTAEIPFGPDDYLVLYSDGVTEAQNRHGEMLELTGLKKLLAEATPESAQDLTNWLFQAVDTFEVGAKRDDLTLLVLRRSPDA